MVRRVEGKMSDKILDGLRKEFFEIGIDERSLEIRGAARRVKRA
jgi:hypothetical protein